MTATFAISTTTLPIQYFDRIKYYGRIRKKYKSTLFKSYETANDNNVKER